MGFLRSLYLDRRFFLAVGADIVLLVLGYLFPPLLTLGKLGAVTIVALVAVDLLLLYGGGRRMTAIRELADKLSNGDDNEIRIRIESRYRFPVTATVIDELPPQFQQRDFRKIVKLAPGGTTTVLYTLRPVTRGEYRFGVANLFAATPVGFVLRRFRLAEECMAQVYPSFLQMRQYELLAISNRLTEAGIKKMRRLGHTMEFDQIKEYVVGDDFRDINWKATARRGGLMVNQYQDEKSQPVYSVIDKGRAMKMPFEGMALLDYAINASLVISNIAMHKQDRAGLITFGQKLDAIVPAERRRAQMQKILEVLYNQTTQYLESSYELLYANVRQKITTRSLILLYTNFETVQSLERQLPYLRRIARSHLLVVIFFENTELRRLLDAPAADTEGIYLKAVAEKFALEKKLIVKELNRHGIHTVLTAPKNLTVDTINKYLELKARRLI